MENQIGKIALLLTLAAAAYEDFKEKEIHFILPLLAASFGIALNLLFREMMLVDILLGTAIGGILLMLAWISRGSIGAGDGMMLVVSGLFLGFWRNVVLLMTAFGMISMAALFLLVIKRKERSYRLPFLPFLLAAYLCLLI